MRKTAPHSRIPSYCEFATHRYVERADGAMDRYATSDAWRRNLAYGALVGRYARGEIDAHRFAAEVRKLG